MKKFNYKKFLAVLSATLVSVIIIFTVRYFTEQNIVSKLETESINAINIQSLNAQTYTEKYGVAASMLSRRPDIVNFIQQSSAVRGFLRDGIVRLLNHTSALSGSKSIWLVDKNGDVLLQSVNTNNSENFPAKNIAREPYFQTAMQGRLGRANLIQNPNNRSYLFGAPIFSNNQIVGATIILVSIENLEQTWALIPDPIIALDKNKNILLSNVKDWRLLTFGLNKQNKLTQENNKDLLIRRNKNKVTTQSTDLNDESQFLVIKKSIPLLEWDLIILQNQKKIKDNLNNSTIIALLGLLLFWLTIWFVWHRNQRIIRERQQQTEFANILEDRVKRRTKAVSIANSQLEKEVEERKATEQELRKTQKELIQAAKMASIGQMSTILAHEYNQPISAIQFYAINAQTLIEESSQGEALDNMSRIEELTKRMASLTNSLRNFAHKPGQKLKKVEISKVIDQLIILMQPRLKAENVELIIHRAPQNIAVMAGSTRLTQILSNLLANSIDALKKQEQEQEQKTITLEWRARDSQMVELLIKDNGPGIPKNDREKLYDAFYTTKGSEDGLGLGLFIVYNLINEIGGKLSILDEDGYGAVFCIELERQDQK